LDTHLHTYDLVIVNDFGHGLLTEKIINKISSEARYLALNVQTNSANIGFNLVTKYPRANCICIDEGELRFATHDRYGDLNDHMERVYKQLNCSHMIATRGEKGSLCYSKSGGFCVTPALANHVVDAIGAGDAFFAFVAPCFAAGLDQEVVSFVGNAVGALAVQIVCNRSPVNMIDLKKYMTRLLK
jgi:sugar/nucleoside kinase (ribokinase family)